MMNFMMIMMNFMMKFMKLPVKFLILKRIFNLTLPLVICLFGLGCASFLGTESWEDRVGSYHFEDAKAEFGKPDRAESLENGGMIATWIWRENPPQIELDTGSTYDPPTDDQLGRSFPTQHETAVESVLNLTFDDEGILIKWSQFDR